jgi:hypothetical protein
VPSFDRYARKYLYRVHRVRALPGIHILSDGICQLMLTVEEETRQKDMSVIWTAFRGRVPLPDLIIFVDASDHDVEARRTGRGNEGDQRVPRLRESDRIARDALFVLLDRCGAGCPRVWSVENCELEALDGVAAALSERIVGALSGLST